MARPVSPRLARLAEPCSSILTYRSLAIAAGEWPVIAANDNTIAVPPPAAAEDQASGHTEHRLDARPSIAYLEALRQPSGDWDLSRLEFQKGAQSEAGSPPQGALLRYLDGRGKWRAAREAFGASRAPRAANDNLPSELRSMTSVDTAIRADGGDRRDDEARAHAFTWSPRFSTAAQRATWRAQVRMFGVDGTVAFADACAAHGLKPRAAPAGPSGGEGVAFPSRTTWSNDAPKHVGRSAPPPPSPAPTIADAAETLALVHQRIGETHAELLRAAAVARTMADLGRLTAPEANERWAAVIGERSLKAAVDALEAALASLRRENLLSAA